MWGVCLVSTYRNWTNIFTVLCRALWVTRVAGWCVGVRTDGGVVGRLGVWHRLGGGDGLGLRNRLHAWNVTR